MFVYQWHSVCVLMYIILFAGAVLNITAEEILLAVDLKFY
jgi:hypothetical protein